MWEDRQTDGASEAPALHMGRGQGAAALHKGSHLASETKRKGIEHSAARRCELQEL